jgi:non-ribosomal peptide synthetase component F
MQGEALERNLSYWKRKLGDAPPFLELPTDRPRPKIRTSNGSCAPLSLSTALTDALKSLSRQEGVTLFMTLLAAFKALLAPLYRQEDVLVGSPISGRGAPQLNDLIGLLVTTLVLRTDLSGSPLSANCWARAPESRWKLTLTRRAPRKTGAGGPAKERSEPHPLFQVMFDLRNPQVLSEIPGVRVERFGFDRGVAQFDFDLELEEKDGGLSCLANYNTDLFNPETVQRLLQSFATLLESIVANPAQRIGQLAAPDHCGAAGRGWRA